MTTTIRLKHNHTTPTLTAYTLTLINHKQLTGHPRTAETYQATLKSFSRFLEHHHQGRRADIHLHLIDSNLLESYQAWQLSCGNTYNTVSFYNRILRAIYNHAIDHDIIPPANPFRHVYTGIDKTIKRAVPLPVIRQIKHLDLTDSPSVDHARDIFMLSFMLRGMSLIDMAYLLKTDRHNGYITYRRHKTGQTLTVQWIPQMQAILNKYPHNPASPYLLPILTQFDTDRRQAYHNACSRINYNLKKIAHRLNLSQPLTMYVARHSWATAAQAKGIPISIISQGLGHDSETTTRIYLANLETAAIDKANTLILKSL
ncbi:MAG: site-specific integrase [Muribaculaceae bacterium]|nr:site-specific integrase [Muribaculaceae bacterium]